MAHEFTMPKLGLTMTDGTIREWLVADGSKVNVGDAVLVIETDKVETEVEAREAGVLSISGVVGENYACGAVIGTLLGEGEAPAAAAQAPAGAHAGATTSAPLPGGAPAARAAVGATAPAGEDIATRGQGGRILASPMARAAARNAGVELAHIAGTGPNGRIVAADVVTRVEALAARACFSPMGRQRLWARVAASLRRRWPGQLLEIAMSTLPESWARAPADASSPTMSLVSPTHRLLLP